MAVLMDCQDVRKMVQIKEVDCPECGAAGGIEVFERDGVIVGDSVCCRCGFTIPESADLGDYLKNYSDDKEL